MNNNLKVILGTVAGVMIGGITVVGANQAIQAIQNTEIKVSLNGQVQEFKDETTGEKQYPITYNNRTYLPLRNVANLAGLSVDYDNASKTAILNRAYSDEQLKEYARAYLKVTTGYVTTYAALEEREDDMVAIQLFDIVGDHNSTSDWYTVNKYTGKGTNVLGENIDISPENIVKLVNKKDSTKDKRNETYKSILSYFYSNNELPGLSELEITSNDKEAKAIDKFAIFDVDKDGKEELIITHENASMAGLFQVIYSYDEDSDLINPKYYGTPINVFYENGYAESQILHNQGEAFNFMWPFHLLKYDTEKKEFTEYAYIDGWDKNFNEVFPTYVTEPFPSEIDKDGDGGIYIVTAKDGKSQNMDNADYEKWLKDNCGELIQMNVPFMSLTQENINSVI